MPTHRDRIIAYLRQHPDGADDDQLSAYLGIRPRQTVNQICRLLAQEGLVTRRREGRDGKINNRWVGAPQPNADLPTQRHGGQTPEQEGGVTGASGTPQALQVVDLADPSALQAFSYEGEEDLREDNVKAALEEVLEAEGWQVTVNYGYRHGIDIEAHRQGEWLIVEAKGGGRYQPMRVNYFLGALGELLQRMESDQPSYALALPAHRHFVSLVQRFPARVCDLLRLNFYLVKRNGNEGYVVGRFTPHVFALHKESIPEGDAAEVQARSPD